MGTRYALAAALWIGWILPFLHKAMGTRQKAVVRDASARWGIILEGASYGVVWGVPELEVPLWRIVIALVLGMASIQITRLAIRHLDRHWRVDAALSANHQLVTTGPYAYVRHPIYAGMLAMLLAGGLLLSRWPALLAGLVMFIAGTEIRVRAEEGLLRSRFGQEFDSYASRVSAYIPYLR